jgi:uncharacterized protein (TIGR00369 family)
MCATIESGNHARAPTQRVTEAQRQHRRCFACGGENLSGLRLHFVSLGDDEVECEFVASGEFQGYRGVVQGGVVATLLDSAMTNVLLQRGIAARTAEMRIRFRHPVPVGKKVVVRGKLELSRGSSHVVAGWVLSGQKVLAEAKATFMTAS